MYVGVFSRKTDLEFNQSTTKTDTCIELKIYPFYTVLRTTNSKSRQLESNFHAQNEWNELNQRGKIVCVHRKNSKQKRKFLLNIPKKFK